MTNVRLDTGISLDFRLKVPKKYLSLHELVSLIECYLINALYNDVHACSGHIYHNNGEVVEMTLMTKFTHHSQAAIILIACWPLYDD